MRRICPIIDFQDNDLTIIREKGELSLGFATLANILKKMRSGVYVLGKS